MTIVEATIVHLVDGVDAVNVFHWKHPNASPPEASWQSMVTGENFWFYSFFPRVMGAPRFKKFHKAEVLTGDWTGRVVEDDSLTSPQAAPGNNPASSMLAACFSFYADKEGTQPIGRKYIPQPALPASLPNQPENDLPMYKENVFGWPVARIFLSEQWGLAAWHPVVWSRKNSIATEIKGVRQHRSMTVQSRRRRVRRSAVVNFDNMLTNHPG